MNYDLLWNIDEYHSLLDYKWNSFKYINMFMSKIITNRERRFNPKSPAYPQTSEEFRNAIETIIKLYKAIKKNYVLNGRPVCEPHLFRGLRKDSIHSYFTSTSKSLDVALSFIDGMHNGDTNNDILVDIEASEVEWIDLELFIPGSMGGDLEEKEILFLPCEYQTLQEMSFPDFLTKYAVAENLSSNTQRKLNRLQNLICRKIKLVAPNYISSTAISLDHLVATFEQYRQNLIKLSEKSKLGSDTVAIEDEIIEFKRSCYDFLTSQFYKIDMEFQKENSQKSTQDKIQIDINSNINEVKMGNSGRMFSIESSDGVEKYYFKPAESKGNEIKPYRAYIQEAAYNVQRIINPARAVKCNACYINGVLGAVQEKIDVDSQLTKQFRMFFTNQGDKLSQKILSQIFDEYLVDYCLCNYDSHAWNFIIDSNGDLRGIDKEQSFRYIESDVNGDMLFSHNYNASLYGESETIYSNIFKKIVNGEISYKVLDGLSYRAARLTQVPDEQYRQMFISYAYDKTKTPQEAEELLDKIVQRKQSIMEKIDNLKNYLYNQSWGKVNDVTEYIFTDNYVSQKNNSNSTGVIFDEEEIDEQFDLPQEKLYRPNSDKRLVTLRDQKRVLCDIKKSLDFPVYCPKWSTSSQFLETDMQTETNEETYGIFK